MVFTFTKYTTTINKKEILILIFFINKPMPATCVGFLFFYPLFSIWTCHWFWIHWFWIHWFCSLDLPHHSQSRVLRTLSRCFAAKIAHYVASYVVSQLHMYITSCLQASLTPGPAGIFPPSWTLTSILLYFSFTDNEGMEIKI